MKSEKWLGIHDRRHKSPCQAVYDVCGLFPVQIDLKILSHKKEHNKEGTAIFKCAKCGAKICTVTRRQTRSADETATAIVQCNVFTTRKMHD